MPDRPTKLRDLKRILRSFGVEENVKRGKGSHLMFQKTFPDGTFTFPIPTTRDPVLQCYVTQCRRKFRLTAADEISDADFYSR